ncbi:hypothetical protein AVEN_213032-1, partial [Araneus ventricosus]
VQLAQVVWRLRVGTGVASSSRVVLYCFAIDLQAVCMKLAANLRASFYGDLDGASAVRLSLDFMLSRDM